jgi:hypothetical protein
MLRGLRRQRGQDMVEFVLILPILLAATFAVVDFGVVFFSFGTLTNAVREGARVGIIRPYADPPVSCNAACRDGKIRDAVLGLAVGLDHSQLDDIGSDLVITRTTDTVTVRVPKYTVQLPVQLPSGLLKAWAGGPISFDLVAVATMQME